MNFKSKYEIEDLVEYEAPVSQQGEPAFGFVTSVRFRKTDAVNFLAEYNIHRCNEDKIDEDIRESEIKAVYRKTTV